MMINRFRRQPVLILDVRNQSEYDQGHLHGANLLPLHVLENWDWNWTSNAVQGQLNINFLQAHANDTIIVYCKSGSRSAEARQILVDHGITDVYNMRGGITAWMKAGYRIYTKYHHVSVDVVNRYPIIKIEPWLLYQSECALCQNQTCSVNNTPATSNANVTVVEEDENHTEYLVTSMVNDTLVESSITKTVLWRRSELEEGFNRTAIFSSIEAIEGDIITQSFALKYIVRCEDYNVTIQTLLEPSNDNSYNESITLVSYVHAEEDYGVY